jgi:hypothetical protein
MQKRQRIPRIDRMREAIEEIGGEPVAGSGFEGEAPDPRYSGAVLLPSTFLPLVTAPRRESD